MQRLMGQNASLFAVTSKYANYKSVAHLCRFSLGEYPSIYNVLVLAVPLRNTDFCVFFLTVCLDYQYIR